VQLVCNTDAKLFAVTGHESALSHAPRHPMTLHGTSRWQLVCIITRQARAAAAHPCLLAPRYPDKEQQELFFRHYMAEDAALQAAGQLQQQQQQQQPRKRGLFSWLRRHKSTHKKQDQQQQPQQQQLHRLGRMELPGGSSSSSGEVTPLSAAVVDQLSASVNVWALASHLYWGIWAIIQVSSRLGGWGRRVE